jgi:hypothetical protein
MIYIRDQGAYKFNSETLLENTITKDILGVPTHFRK